MKDFDKIYDNIFKEINEAVVPDKDAPKNWEDTATSSANSVASAINTLVKKTVGDDVTKYTSIANSAKSKFISLLDKAIKINFDVLNKQTQIAKQVEAKKK